MVPSWLKTLNLSKVLITKYIGPLPYASYCNAYTQIEEDEVTHEKILTFEICCQHSSAGCNWTGILKDLPVRAS